MSCYTLIPRISLQVLWQDKHVNPMLFALINEEILLLFGCLLRNLDTKCHGIIFGILYFFAFCLYLFPWERKSFFMG